jgi:hypothetical protein
MSIEGDVVYANDATLQDEPIDFDTLHFRRKAELPEQAAVTTYSIHPIQTNYNLYVSEGRIGRDLTEGELDLRSLIIVYRIRSQFPDAAGEIGEGVEQQRHYDEGTSESVSPEREELEARISGLGEVSPDAITKAAMWLSRLQRAVANRGQDWYEPHLTASPEHELVCEWWFNDRKLTVYISDDDAEFIRVWGANIETEMDEGDAEDEIEILQAWQWLTS